LGKGVRTGAAAALAVIFATSLRCAIEIAFKGHETCLVRDIVLVSVVVIALVVRA